MTHQLSNFHSVNLLNLEVVCMPKKEGGLGVINLKWFNTALISNGFGRFCTAHISVLLIPSSGMTSSPSKNPSLTSLDGTLEEEIK